MLKSVTHITIYVDNQDEALDFYTKKLGFVVHTDAMFGEDLRWLTICLAQQKDFEISLMLAMSPEEKALVGKQGASKPLLALACDSCEKTHEEIKKQGIKILGAPEKQPWGTSMLIADLYGNRLYVVES
jgi:predicted enzyme related to lactoylglutathione lyase